MRRLHLLFALPLLALATAAHADTTFSFSFGETGDNIIGSGTFTGSLSAPDTYTINSVAGITSYLGGSDLAITGLLPTDPNYGNDDQLTLTADGYKFDDGGILYQLSDGSEVNLYTSAGLDNEFLVNSTQLSEDVAYSVAPTPEPGSWALLATGLVGVTALTRRRLASALPGR